MFDDNRKMIAEQIGSAINSLVALGIQVSLEIDDPDRKLPAGSIDAALSDMLIKFIRAYKTDTDGLYAKYREGPSWKAAMRKHFGMDDADEKGYWFYSAYDAVPNKLFIIYFEEHPVIAMEKVLEMFERGTGELFLKHKFDLIASVGETRLLEVIDEVLGVIDDRIGCRQLSLVKETALFINYLSTVFPKHIKRYIAMLEEKEDSKELAETCTDLAIRMNPEQTAFAFIAT